MNFDFLMKPIEGLLINIIKTLYLNIGNYGLSIIAVTVIIKVCILPLTLKQDKSMREMRRIQPEVEKLREKYKDNPEELNKETMKLYQTHKVNPLGGCLPALIQLPIWIALYTVLQPASKLIPAGTTFIIWDLTSKDNLFILPIINAIIVFAQQYFMTPDIKTNEQARMMMFMFPVVILIMSQAVPAGLQIYWITSSGISFLQQFILMNFISENKEYQKSLKDKSKIELKKDKNKLQKK